MSKKMTFGELYDKMDFLGIKELHLDAYTNITIRSEKTMLRPTGKRYVDLRDEKWVYSITAMELNFAESHKDIASMAIPVIESMVIEKIINEVLNE